MRLSWSASVSEIREDQRLGNSRARKKHKRLDAICDKEYSQCHAHGGVKIELSECNVGSGSVGDESELRRSTRVRRAPVVLDGSPPPAKKRQCSGDSVGKVKRASPCLTSREMEGELGSWGVRLRSRTKNGKFGKMENSSPRGKKKLFLDFEGFTEKPKLEVGEGLEGGRSTVVKSNRPGRIKASKVLRNGHQDIDLGSVREDGQEKNEVGSGNEGEVKDNTGVIELLEDKESEVPTSLHVQHIGWDEQLEQSSCVKDGENYGNIVEHYIANVSAQHVEWDKQLEQQSCVNGGENQRKAVEIGGCDLNLEDKIFKKVDKINYTIKDELVRPRIKEGMRCSLCGGGADGKPPKKLVHDGTGSDNEAYCGSSASEEPNYDIWDGFGDEPGWLGRLFGPIKDRNGIARYWVHQNCAVWSPEVYFAGLGRLKNVRAALCRGRVLKCSQCGRPGATVGCRVDRCPKTYHLPCARANGCVFDHRKFLIACTLHRKLFQPHGGKYLYRLKRKKMKLEMRKMSNDSCRKDLEAEEKWLENCGEDEEFLKRESKRLHRDLLRLAPVYIGGSKSESEIQFQGWESVAGLQEVIQCLKEVVILPLLYPDFFNNMGLTPPRGVLLHGCPGTGKTLVVRALIGSCARGDKRIAYFARKGADCLGKYVGDAERQLRLLFQVAEKSQPSIIFFDEIDGLAPPRTRHQDQTHSSVVSTLLALMDGLKSRGSVVVIGATNRPDAVDPALRRPGRFDREIYFPLPSVKDREAILSLQTQKWPNPVTGSLRKWIARRTVGFAGADLQALCTQAAIIALKRSCPLQKLLSAAEEKAPHARRPSLPTFTVEDMDWMEAISCGPPPCSRREAGTAANDVVSSPLPAHLVHCLLQPLCNFLVSFYIDERVWWPTLSKAAILIRDVIVSTLDKKKLQNVCWWSHVHDLLQEVDVASEIESKLSCASILVGDNSFHGFDAVDDDTSDGSLKFEPSLVEHRGSRTSLLQNGSYALQKKSCFRILISGNPRTGQRHLASCILHCFVGNAEIRKVDLATIQQEGHGDVIQGVTQILMRCSSVGSCMIFMPKIDLWAVEACYKVSEEKSDYPTEELESSEEKKSCFTQSEVFNKENNSHLVVHTTETAESQGTALEASCIWNSFVEQMKSVCVSTYLMILATSEVPFQLLPFSIRQFFWSGVMNCSHSTPLMDTVPRFSIQIEGNFNLEIVIDSSAAKLSKDLARHFVELAHHRTHIFVESSFEEDKAWDKLENEADGVCHNLDCASPVMRVSLPPNKRIIIGKSSLMLAISTFGYQILQYPHFAELCWVTSKLKEGPCADINGHWKGWPFNSCITRLNGSSETVTVACSSSNFKSKEKYGSVRGLIAVGLSAYRGVYTSLSEVSCEVRKVLEILARKVKAKIKVGKDRYQFTHLLSQAANLQDMVNSWACTLQSLEADAQLGGANPKLTCERFLDTCDTCKDHLVQSNGCKSGVSNKIPHNLEVLEKEHLFDAKNNQLDAKLLNAHKEATSERTEVDGDFGDFGSLKHPNGYTCIDSAVLRGDGPCGSGDLGGVNFSTTRKECNLVNSLSSSYKNVDINHSSNRTAGLVCLHYCCSECLFNLHRLIKKILIRECGRKGSSWVVEDIHDIVSSISASLHLAICQAESSINKNPNHDNYKILFQDLKMGTCRCKNSGNRLIMPVECSCHSRSKSRKAKHRLDLKLVYRDGLVAIIDPEEHVSFHCKFNSFCLCSLLEMIVLTVQPLD